MPFPHTSNILPLVMPISTPPKRTSLLKLQTEIEDDVLREVQEFRTALMSIENLRWSDRRAISNMVTRFSILATARSLKRLDVRVDDFIEFWRSIMLDRAVGVSERMEACKRLEAYRDRVVDMRAPIRYRRVDRPKQTPSERQKRTFTKEFLEEADGVDDEGESGVDDEV